MTRKSFAFAMADASTAPALAETGAGLDRIRNAANVYGRAGMPAASVDGVALCGQPDVNVVGRGALPAAGACAVIGNARGASEGFGRP
jgi:hypothetical protein